MTTNPFDELIWMLIPVAIIAIVALISVYVLLRISRTGRAADPDSRRANIDRLKRITGSNDDSSTGHDRAEGHA